jgi:hypothetical protein
MINPVELRERNLVFVAGLGEVKIANKGELNLDEDNELIPILITEDRVKRSFESSGNLFDMRLYKIGIVRVTFVDDVASVSLKVSASAPYFRLEHIKHLHQLQNLVLDLCQDEVTF